MLVGIVFFPGFPSPWSTCSLFPQAGSGSYVTSPMSSCFQHRARPWCGTTCWLSALVPPKVDPGDGARGPVASHGHCSLVGNKAILVERIRKQLMSINVLLGDIFPPGFCQMPWSSLLLNAACKRRTRLQESHNKLAKNCLSENAGI